MNLRVQRLPWSQCGPRLLLAAVVCLASWSFAATASTTDWPTIALPPGLVTFEIGRELIVNGQPMRLRGFVSRLTVNEAMEAFRASLGQPSVENHIGRQRVLGRLQGKHYLSVQIEASGTGSRGIVAVNDLEAGESNRPRFEADRAHWLALLPAGSRLLGTTESHDAGKRSDHLVIVNGLGERANRERLIALMHEKGLELEREGGQDVDGAASGYRANTAGGHVFLFKGHRREAQATLSRDSIGQTLVVLNIVAATDLAS